MSFKYAKCQLLLLVYGTLSAQQQNALPIHLEDPELYYAFFRAHAEIDQKIQASAVAAASQLSASTAALYGISADDLSKLTVEVRKFSVNNGAMFLQEQAYLAQQRAAKKTPDVNTIVNYQWQRQQLVINAHAGIRNALKPSNWANLYGYINGAFRASLSQGQGGAK